VKSLMLDGHAVRLQSEGQLTGQAGVLFLFGALALPVIGCGHFGQNLKRSVRSAPCAAKRRYVVSVRSVQIFYLPSKVNQHIVGSVLSPVKSFVAGDAHLQRWTFEDTVEFLLAFKNLGSRFIAQHEAAWIRRIRLVAEVPPKINHLLFDSGLAGSAVHYHVMNNHTPMFMAVNQAQAVNLDYRSSAEHVGIVRIIGAFLGGFGGPLSNNQSFVKRLGLSFADRARLAPPAAPPTPMISGNRPI
jgi:hypothetical protein